MRNLYKPQVYTGIDLNTAFTVEQLKQEYPDALFLDTIEEQLKELYKVRNPQVSEVDTSEFDTFVKNEVGDKTLHSYGSWVYFPWKNTFVHVLGEEAFFEVRTNRNNNKISLDEQKELKNKTIGVIGLSVGQSVALTIAMERVCGKLRLADFDTIELSNLNRIRTSVTNLGLSKAVVVAREIAEIDPYLEVELFEEGLTTANMGEFFEQDGKKLDLLIELCDGLEIKLKCREMARRLSIPVLMETNDRCMIDIERYDQEPERALLHGLVSDSELAEISNLTPPERLGLILKIVDQKNLSPKMLTAFGEIGKTIRSWPQLASSVTMGAGVVTDLARKILLKESCHSGRWYFDIDEILLQDGVHFD